MDLNIEYVTNAEGLHDMAEAMRADTWLPAVDTETVFRQELEDDNIAGAVRVVSVATMDADGNERIFVVDCRDAPKDVLAQVMGQFDVCAWNANFDSPAMDRSGIPPRSWWCAMITDAILRCGRSGVSFYRSLAAASMSYLGEDMSGKGTTSVSFDAVSDLTDEQVRYAGHDASVTRRIADIVLSRAEEEDLALVVSLEQGARPFIDRMMRNGVPFDLDGYLEEAIAERQAEADALMSQLGEMTESSGHMSLFGGEAEMKPSWNPASKDDAIRAFNRWAPDAVKAHMERTHGVARLLDRTDSMRADDIKQIDSDLVRTYLKWQKARKELTTYSDKLRPFHRNDRFFSRYRQALTSTGRLKSDKFNAQNMAPAMHRYMRAPEGTVFVYMDISQAELRFTASYAGETIMIAAFESGDDLHRITMTFMNQGVDIDSFSVKEMKDKRTAAKTVNFGMVYGIGAARLGRNLTNAGVETSTKEAGEYIDAFFSGYPKVHEYLTTRGKEVDDIAADMRPEGFDLDGSMTLYSILSKVAKAWSSSGWTYIDPESLDPSEDGWGRYSQMTREELARWVETVREGDVAVLLNADGTPFTFGSRNVSNRRRLFDVAMDHDDQFSDLLPVTILRMAESKKDTGRAFMARFAAKNALKFPTDEEWADDKLSARMQVLDAFRGPNGKQLRSQLMSETRTAFGEEAFRRLLTTSAAECVRSKRNAWKNHPIQSGVSDVMERIFGTLNDCLPQGVEPILTVHDSMILECPADLAKDVAVTVKKVANDAMEEFCLGVVPKIDVDVRESVSDADVLYEV